MADENHKIIGKYKGRILDSETEKYNKLKLTFDVDGKDWNFTAFMNKDKEGKIGWVTKAGPPKKGTSPTKLEDGEYYEIVYTEFKKEGWDYPAKTVKNIFHQKEVSKGKAAQESPSTNPFQTTNDHLDAIGTAYFKTVPETAWGVNHFIGTVFKTINKDACQKVVDMFKEHTTPT